MSDITGPWLCGETLAAKKSLRTRDMFGVLELLEFSAAWNKLWINHDSEPKHKKKVTKK